MPYSLWRKCKNILILKGEKKCQLKENFCRMCCDYHVGKFYKDKNRDCKKKCSSMSSIGKSNENAGSEDFNATNLDKGTNTSLIAF